MRHPPRYRWFKTLTLFCLLGCGSQPTTQTAGERVIANPRAQNSALTTCRSEDWRLRPSQTLVDSILVSTTHEETKLEARFVMAQAINAEDVGRGSDAFVSLLSDVPDSPLRQKVLLQLLVEPLCQTVCDRRKNHLSDARERSHSQRLGAHHFGIGSLHGFPYRLWHV